MACLSDRDCPGTLVCYNTSWTQYQAVCLCSTWFGFSGVNCEHSFQTVTSQWRIVTTIFLVIGWISGFFIGLYEIRRLLKYKKEWTVTHTCQIQLIFACAFCFTSEAMGLVTSVHAQDLRTYLVGTNMKTTELFYPEQLITVLGYCFIFLALATLPLHWRELTNQAFRRNKRKLSYIRPLIVFELLFSGLTVVFVAMSNPSAAYISAIPFVCLVIIAYGICGLALYRVLTKIAESQQTEQRVRFLKSARNVQITSLKMFVIGLLILILNLTFALIASDPEWREHSPEGQISEPVLVGTFLTYVLLSAMIVGQTYLSATIRSTIARATLGSGAGTGSNNKTPVERRVDSFTGDFSGKPDSLVALDDVNEIKKKTKALAKKREPRLRAITDMSEQATSTANPQHQMRISVELPGDITTTPARIGEESSVNLGSSNNNSYSKA